MPSDKILLEKENGIARIYLNRPKARNAWDEEMTQAFIQTIQALQDQQDTRVIIITGSGKAFCAGGDLVAMQEKTGMFEGDPVTLRTKYARGLQNITRTLDHLEIPTIAQINGPAIGAGLDLSLMCDIRIATKQAIFGSTFASVGLIPGDGGAFLLTRCVGFSRAVELILTARIFDAEEALQMGMLHYVTDSNEQLAQKATEIAEQIASLPAPALQMAKVALYRTYHQDIESALQLTAALQGLVQHSPEHLEAVQNMLSSIQKKKR